MRMPTPSLRSGEGARPMDIHRRSSTVVLLAATASLLLAACNEPPPATIRYEQRGACNGFKHPGGTSVAGPNHAFVVFRVSTITNTEPKAKDFDFNPERLYVDQTDPAAFVDTDFHIATLNPFALMGRLVKA